MISQQLKNGKLLIKNMKIHHLLCGFIGTKCRGGSGSCQPQGQALFGGNFRMLSSSKCLFCLDLGMLSLRKWLLGVGHCHNSATPC